MRDEKKIDRNTYRRYYMRAKGGEFRSKQHLKTHMTTDGILKEDKKQ